MFMQIYIYIYIYLFTCMCIHVHLFVCACVTVSECDIVCVCVSVCVCVPGDSSTEVCYSAAIRRALKLQLSRSTVFGLIAVCMNAEFGSASKHFTCSLVQPKAAKPSPQAPRP